MSIYVAGYSTKNRRMRRNTTRLTRRAVLLILPLLLLLSAMFIIWHSAAANTSQQAVYVVQPGDSLWAIARAHASEQMDIRIYIQQLRQINQLPQSVIHIGQTLVLPTR